MYSFNDGVQDITAWNALSYSARWNWNKQILKYANLGVLWTNAYSTNVQRWASEGELPLVLQFVFPLIMNFAPWNARRVIFRVAAADWSFDILYF